MLAWKIHNNQKIYNIMNTKTAEVENRTNTGDITEARQHILDQVSNHVRRTPFSEKLLEFIGCELEASVCCKYSRKPMYGCTVQNIPAECPEALKEFVQDGIFSMPCVYYDMCRNWMFFRCAEFYNNDSMRIHWEEHNRHRTAKRPRHFICPACMVS